MMTALAKILHPYSLDQFLSENWTRRGVMLPAENPDRFQDLFSWQKLNYLLNFHELKLLHFILDGEILPCRGREDWLQRCKQGATLRISHVHEQIPSLADLTWAIQQETGHGATHANIYCSWPSQQGSKCHFDGHEVFVIQIDGEKEWFVFEDTLKYPYNDENSKDFPPPDRSPYIHCVLKPGDCLYIPRGHWHHALALQQPSLHVTLGVRCFNGRDFLTWLSKTIPAMLQEEEIWRENLPLISHGDTQAFETHVQHLFNVLPPLLSREKDNLVKRVVACQRQTTTQPPEISLPDQVGFNLFGQGLDTCLRQPRFQSVKLEPLEGGNYLLSTPQKTMKFKGLEPKVINILVENLFSQKSFTIRDVADWLPDCSLETHVIPLLAGLVKEGFLIEESSQLMVDNCQREESSNDPQKVLALHSR